MATLQKGTIINNKWKLGDLIGEGACAKVYDIFPINNKDEKKELVIKIIELDTNYKGKKKAEQKNLCDTLFYEYTLYSGVLTNFPYLPYLPISFYNNDNKLNIRYIILEKFQYDLKKFSIINHNDINYMLKSIGNYGKTILNGLKYFHQNNLLYIDLKPENFMLNKNNQLYFIDCKLFFYYYYIFIFLY